MEKSGLRDLSIEQIRHHIRSGAYSGDTMGVADGYVQANLVILPKEVAFDFLVFCQRNPKPCPLLDVTRPGSPVPELLAPGADLRTDIPRYRVFRRGELVDEPTDIRSYWRDDLIAFLLGCSATFDNALRNARVPLRFLDQDTIPPVYETNVQCRRRRQKPCPKMPTLRCLDARPIVPDSDLGCVIPYCRHRPPNSALPAKPLNTTARDEPC